MLSIKIGSGQARIYCFLQKKGKDPSANDEPHSGVYPLISVLGEDFGSVKLPSFVQPPQVCI